MTGKIRAHRAGPEFPEFGQPVRCPRDDRLSVSRECNGENVTRMPLGIDLVQRHQLGPRETAEQGHEPCSPGELPHPPRDPMPISMRAVRLHESSPPMSALEVAVEPLVRAATP